MSKMYEVEYINNLLSSYDLVIEHYIGFNRFVLLELVRLWNCDQVPVSGFQTHYWSFLSLFAHIVLERSTNAPYSEQNKCFNDGFTNNLSAS